MPEIDFAGAFLPRAKRDGGCTVAAFGRMIQQAFAAAHSPEACLAMVRERLDEIFGDDEIELPEPQFRTDHQHILQAVRVTARRYEIPKQHFLDLAEGWRQDAAVTRYATWGALRNHCDCTGGAMAVLVAGVLGLTHSDGHRFALAMGSAIRLTQIVSELKTDSQRARIYLPLEDLARFRYSQSDLAAGAANDNFRELMRFEIARARELYRQGAEGLCWLAGDGSRLAVSVVAMMQAQRLKRIESIDHDVFNHGSRVEIGLGRKLRIILSAYRLARRQAGQPLPNVFG